MSTDALAAQMANAAVVDDTQDEVDSDGEDNLTVMVRPRAMVSLGGDEHAPMVSMQEAETMDADDDDVMDAATEEEFKQAGRDRSSRPSYPNFHFARPRKVVEEEPNKKAAGVRFGVSQEIAPADDADAIDDDDTAPAYRKRTQTVDLSPAIKQGRLRTETQRERWERIHRDYQEAARLQKRLTKGCWLVKLTDDGKPSKRWMEVSEDGTELHWRKSKAANFFGSKGKTQLLADVTAIFHGSHTSSRFEPYYNARLFGLSGKPWLAFTIKLPDATIELVAPDERVMSEWFQGLQSLIPLNKRYLNKGAMLWQRLIMKINAFGLAQFIRHFQSLRRRQAIAAARIRLKAGKPV